MSSPAEVYSIAISTLFQRNNDIKQIVNSLQVTSGLFCSRVRVIVRFRDSYTVNFSQNAPK